MRSITLRRQTTWRPQLPLRFCAETSPKENQNFAGQGRAKSWRSLSLCFPPGE